MNAPATLTIAKIVADEHGISWAVNLSKQHVTASWRDADGTAQHTSVPFSADNDQSIVEVAIVSAVMSAFSKIVGGAA